MVWNPQYNQPRRQGASRPAAGLGVAYSSLSNGQCSYLQRMIDTLKVTE